MATEGKYVLTEPFRAAEELSARQYQVVTIADDKIANNGQEASGVLLTKPKSGEDGSILLFGVGKVREGLAVTKNATITTVTSGYITVTASGDYINGRALEAITSGSIGRVFWQGNNHYQVSSLDG